MKNNLREHIATKVSSKGAALVEYVTLLAAVSLVSIAAVQTLGVEVADTFDVTTGSISSSLEFVEARDGGGSGGSGTGDGGSAGSIPGPNGGTIKPNGDWCPASSWSYNRDTMTYTVPGWVTFHMDKNHAPETRGVFVDPGSTAEVGVGQSTDADIYSTYVRKKAEWSNIHYWTFTTHIEGNTLQAPGPSC